MAPVQEQQAWEADSIFPVEGAHTDDQHENDHVETMELDSIPLDAAQATNLRSPPPREPPPKLDWREQLLQGCNSHPHPYFASHPDCDLGTGGGAAEIQAVLREQHEQLMQRLEAWMTKQDEHMRILTGQQCYTSGSALDTSIPMPRGSLPVAQEHGSAFSLPGSAEVWDQAPHAALTHVKSNESVPSVLPHRLSSAESSSGACFKEVEKSHELHLSPPTSGRRSMPTDVASRSSVHTYKSAAKSSIHTEAKSVSSSYAGKRTKTMDTHSGKKDRSGTIFRLAEAINGFAKDIHSHFTLNKAERCLSQLHRDEGTAVLKSCATNLTRSTETGSGSLHSQELPEEDNLKPGMSFWQGQEQSPRMTLSKLVHGHCFELFFGIVIITNSIYIGVEVQYTADHPMEATPLGFYVVGYTYTFLFTIELVLRLAADRLKFWWTDTSQMLWNWLDILIVCSSLFEVGLDIVTWMTTDEDDEDAEGGGVNMSNLRIVRIIRITRLMRLFRIGRIVRFVRALRTLVFSIVSTLKSVVWSLLLLTMIIYVFAIVFTQAASDHMTLVEVSGEQTLSPLMAKLLLDHWGSLALSMLSLFMSVAGGVSWLDVVQPLWDVDEIWLYIFLVFIGFVYFAVLNVVTGVFCQSAIESSQQDQETMVQAFLSNKKLYTGRFKHLFTTIDTDESGTITKDEFLNHINDVKVNAYFATLGLEPTDAVNLFKMLDVNDENDVGIDIEDFVDGCLRLKGAAKSCDVARLMYENKAIMRELTDFVTFAEEKFECITHVLAPITPERGAVAFDSTRASSGRTKPKRINNSVFSRAGKTPSAGKPNNPNSSSRLPGAPDAPPDSHEIKPSGILAGKTFEHDEVMPPPLAELTQVTDTADPSGSKCSSLMDPLQTLDDEHAGRGKIVE